MTDVKFKIAAQITQRVVEKQLTARGCGKDNGISIAPQCGQAVAKYLTCLGLNARSINNKAEDITEYIQEKGIDVSAITETSLSDDQDSLVNRSMMNQQSLFRNYTDLSLQIRMN